MDRLNFFQEQVNINGRLITYNNHDCIQTLVTQIRTDRIGGETFRRNLFQLGIQMGQIGLTNSNNSIIVKIPRGGIDMGNGIQTINPDSCSFQTNDGAYRDQTKPLLPEEFPDQGYIDDVIITDGAVVTGKTINQTIRAINAKIKVGTFHIVIAVSSSQGIDVILGNKNASVYVGQTEDRILQRYWNFQIFPTLANVGNIGYLASRT